MDRMLRYILIVAIALVTVATTCDAQYNSRRKKKSPFLQGFSAKASLGANMFFGDIQDSKRVGFSGFIGASKQIIKPLTVRCDIDFGRLQGKARWGGEFSTFYFDFMLGADYIFLNQMLGYDANRLFEPYISGGLGLMMFNPNNTTEWKNLPHSSQVLLDNISTFTAAPAVFGIGGVRYNINRHWSAMLEIKGQMPFGSNSDALDGQDSGMGMSLKDFKDAAVGGVTSADKDGNDMPYLGQKAIDAFYVITIGAAYKFEDMQWRSSSKYNRKTYINNRKKYKRNAQRTRRR